MIAMVWAEVLRLAALQAERLATEVGCQRKAGGRHERSESTGDFLVTSTSNDKFMPSREGRQRPAKGRAESRKPASTKRSGTQTGC